MNRAEILAKVRAHTERQGTPCCTDKGEPVYRKDGKACFIGRLLGDRYVPAFEGLDPEDSVPLLMALGKEIGWPVNAELIEFVNEIDAIHLGWCEGKDPDWPQVIKELS